MAVDAETIVQKVEAMRHSQKEYFRTRSHDALEESKRLEREVDRLLREYRNPQRELF